MQFCVFAFATVPDVHTARRVMGLDDLDDKSVSKVLFHRRKQQTGRDEQLRWDQQMIAATTLVAHTPDTLALTSMDLSTHDEESMLRAFHAASRATGVTASWDGGVFALPLVRFRSLLHRLELPDTAPDGHGDAHLDLAAQLSPTITDRPSLDETARKLGYPGLLGSRDDRLTEAWLAGRNDALRAHSDLTALNTYLIALRLYHMRGTIDARRTGDFESRLHAAIAQRQPAHHAAFLAAWDAV